MAIRLKVGVTVGFALMFGVLISCAGETAKEVSDQVVFMENATVFESFEMKKDYDKIMEKEMTVESSLLDSLGVLLNQAQGGSDSLVVYKLRRDYYMAEQIFNEKFEEFSTQFTAEVNERLNSYIEEFGKAKKYPIILGSAGQGNVMYVEKSKNITDDLIKFINSKYKKK
jgi:outer membrane protein